MVGYGYLVEFYEKVYLVVWKNLFKILIKKIFYLKYCLIYIVNVMFLRVCFKGLKEWYIVFIGIRVIVK